MCPTNCHRSNKRRLGGRRAFAQRTACPVTAVGLGDPPLTQSPRRGGFVVGQSCWLFGWGSAGVSWSATTDQHADAGHGPTSRLTAHSSPVNGSVFWSRFGACRSRQSKHQDAKPAGPKAGGVLGPRGGGDLPKPTPPSNVRFRKYTSWHFTIIPGWRVAGIEPAFFSPGAIGQRSQVRAKIPCSTEGSWR